MTNKTIFFDDEKIDLEVEKRISGRKSMELSKTRRSKKKVVNEQYLEMVSDLEYFIRVVEQTQFDPKS